MLTDGTRAQREARLDLLATAFASDPFYAWLFPSERRRVGAIRRFLGGAVRGRRLRVVLSNDDPALVVGAVLDEPWGLRPNWREVMASAPAIVWAMVSGTWPEPWRLWTALRLLAALGARRPRTPHLHLALVAVAPATRGTGIGMAIVAALWDEGPGHLHLETSRTTNRGFYARLGMTETGEVRQGGAPPVWIYERRAP